MPVLRTAISGSYHRDPEGLQQLYEELAALGCQILSPFTPIFLDTHQTFVMSGGDELLTPAELERRHLASIAHADFLWLHAPDGYVGLSGAFEMGFATAQNKPIFSLTPPQENVLQPFVTPASSVFHALRHAKFL